MTIAMLFTIIALLDDSVFKHLDLSSYAARNSAVEIIADKGVEVIPGLIDLYLADETETFKKVVIEKVVETWEEEFWENGDETRLLCVESELRKWKEKIDPEVCATQVSLIENMLKKIGVVTCEKADAEVALKDSKVSVSLPYVEASDFDSKEAWLYLQGTSGDLRITFHSGNGDVLGALKKLRKVRTRIKSLNFTDPFRDSEFQNVIMRFPAIRDLTLPLGCKLNDSEVAELVSSFSLLEQFRSSEDTGVETLTELARKDHLISLCLKLDDMDTSSLAILGKIRQVEFVNCSWYAHKRVNKEQLRALKQLHSLEHLLFPGCEANARSQLAEFSKLRHLDMMQGIFSDESLLYTDEDIEAVSQMKDPVLSGLTIGANTITRQGLFSLLKLKSLKQIKFSSCRYLTDEDVQDFSEKYRHLHGTKLRFDYVLEE